MTSKASASTHPCYSEKAHRFFSRMHLPVAPKCNIQCNYCNRKYDCVNESRPGVTSQILTPEQAFEKVSAVASGTRDLSVIGIAGPGDALANPERSFRTFKLLKKTFPDLLFCLSTNGLELARYIEDLKQVGVNHVTVTINTTNPETAEKIYSSVRINGKRRSDKAAIAEFLLRQQEGVKAALKAGMLVKVNSLLIPGINDNELVSLSKRLKLMGVTLHNIMPLIAKPEHGTLFGKQNRPTPSHEQLEEIRKACGLSKQMAHCRQCRADAVGRLGDSSNTSSAIGDSQWLEADYGFEKRKNWRNLVQHMLMPQPMNASSGSVKQLPPSSTKIAVCSRGTGFADLELAHTREFYIYQMMDGVPTLLNVRRMEKDSSLDFVENVLRNIEGCNAILSHKFGFKTFKRLEDNNIMPISDLSELPIEKAVTRAAGRLKSTAGCAGSGKASCSCGTEGIKMVAGKTL